MNIERIISEYKNELSSLRIALNLTDINDTERRLRISEQIEEIEELIEDLKEEKESQKNIYED